MGKIIGIDLGTTNSCVSFMDGKDPVVVANSEGQRTTPSIVAFTAKGERLVGQPAKNQIVTNPENTVYSVKRYMGLKMNEVIDADKKVPYKLTQSDNQSVRIEIKGKKYSPEELSAAILQKMKKTAEDYLGESVTEAVITVPAYFNDAQRQATKDAGRIAGLDVKRIVNEPTAAALAYGLDKDKNKNEKIAVYDFGGGTFDISILELGDGVFEVKSTNGDTHLGGDDIDNIIINWLADEFKKDNSIDLRTDKMALQRLKDAAEKAKIELSSSTSTEINLPFITADSTGPKHLQRTLSRALFEQLADGVIKRTKEPCMNALRDAGLKASDIDSVILVGGSTRIPKVQALVKEIFGKEPHKGVNPDEVVAIGAGIQGSILKGDVKDVLLLDVTPLSLGIETMGGINTKLIERNTTIPTKKSQIFSTAVDNQPAVTVVVLQGEREMAADNRVLGRFDLTGIPAAPRGVPQIEVSFDIDANGIVNVSAKDLGTGKSQEIKIESSSGLPKEEIDKMVQDAKEHEAEDKEKKEKIDTRNSADALIYGTEKSLKEYGDKLSEDDKKKIEDAIKDLKDTLAKDDASVSDIKAKSDTLQQSAYKLAEEMYKNAQSAQGGAGAAGAQGPAPDMGASSSAGSSGPADAQETSYTVVDDDKK